MVRVFAEKPWEWRWEQIIGPGRTGTGWAPFDAHAVADRLRRVQVRLGVLGIGFEFSAF